MNVLEQVPNGGRILIIRLRSLGDCVLTTPAIRLLKQARPDCRIGVVVEERFTGVYTGNPDIDEILTPSKVAVARFGADLCLNLHGGTRSITLTAVSRARWRAGFGHFRGSFVYNIRIPRAQEILGLERTVHTAEHVASAMFFLGVARQEIPRATLYAGKRMRGSYAVIHPTASAPEKTWPAVRFLEVAGRLGMEAVFIGGPGEDLSAFAGHRVELGSSLETIKNLLAGASLFVGNDSGPAHMAAAFGLPVVVLFGTSDPVVWAPWKTQAESLVANGPVNRISTEDVLSAIERVRVKA